MCKSVKMFAVMLLLAVGFGVTDHCSLTADVFAGSKQINFQGKLTDNNGAIVPDGLKAMKFHLYPAIDATTDEWNENVNVYVSSGLFNVTLGKVNSLDGVAFNKQYWLGIDVNSVELLPRQELAASAYALGSLGDFNINGKALISGNVGIGTASPATKLHVSGGGSVVSVGNFGTELKLENAATVSGTGSGSGIASNGSGLDLGAWSQPITFSFAGSEKIRIKPDGNVGIETTDPKTKLHISGSGSIISLGNFGSEFYLSNSATVPDGPGSGTGISSNGSEVSIAAWAGPVTIYSGNNGSTKQPRMSITGTGNVGIGTTNPGWTLHVNGTAYCAGGNWSASDERLKSSVQIVSASGFADKVKNINAIKYKLNKDSMKKMKVGAKDMADYENKVREDVLRQSSDTAKIPKMIEERKKTDEDSLDFCDDTQLGVSAQELEAQFPELVKTDENGYKAVAYDRLSVVLLEAIKEQQKKIEELEAKMNTLVK